MVERLGEMRRERDQQIYDLVGELVTHYTKVVSAQTKTLAKVMGAR